MGSLYVSDAARVCRRFEEFLTKARTLTAVFVSSLIWINVWIIVVGHDVSVSKNFFSWQVYLSRGHCIASNASAIAARHSVTATVTAAAAALHSNDVSISCMMMMMIEHTWTSNEAAERFRRRKVVRCITRLTEVYISSNRLISNVCASEFTDFSLVLDLSENNDIETFPTQDLTSTCVTGVVYILIVPIRWVQLFVLMSLHFDKYITIVTIIIIIIAIVVVGFYK